MRPALSNVLGSSSTRALLAKAVRASAATNQAAAASAPFPHRLPTTMATHAATSVPRAGRRAPSRVCASTHARARVTATPRKLGWTRGVVTARAVEASESSAADARIRERRPSGAPLLARALARRGDAPGVRRRLERDALRVGGQATRHGRARVRGRPRPHRFVPDRLDDDHANEATARRGLRSAPSGSSPYTASFASARIKTTRSLRVTSRLSSPK